MSQIIAFLSGKGGTGKTALCAGIASALAQSGKRVLCIDADVGLRSLDLFLGLGQTQALSFSDICQGQYPLEMACPHPQFPTLRFLTAPANGDYAQVALSDLQAMLTRAKETFDYILLDGPAGFGPGFEMLAHCAQQCVVCCLPDPASIRGAQLTGQRLEMLGMTHVRLVVNRVYRELLKSLCMNIDDIMDTTGLPLLGVVPADPNISHAMARGKNLLLYSGGGATPACRRIAKRLQGQLVPVAIR